MLNYRIKQVVDLNGSSTFTVQRKMLGMWWNVYIADTYGTPRFFEIMFGTPVHFYKFKDAKDWIMRRLNKEDTKYYYYPFEANNN